MQNFISRNAKDLRRILLYATLLLFILFIKLFIEQSHFSPLIYLVLSAIFIIPECISEYKPEYMGWIIANRIAMVGGVLFICIAIGSLCFYRHPIHSDQWMTFEAQKDLLRTVIQGLILGLTGRMLFTHLSYQLIEAKGVFTSKVLILFIYMAFLVILPLRHSYLRCPLFISFGIGFVIHYVARASERRNARHVKLRNNLLSMVTSDNAIGLLAIEEKIIKLFAYRRWQALRRLLRTTGNETAKIFFVRVAMHTILHEHDTVLLMLEEIEANRPDWYEENRHYLLLLRALNRYHRKPGTHLAGSEIFDDLAVALSMSPECVLSNATLAFLSANNDQQPEKALWLIEHAMALYEQQEAHPEPASFIIGMIESCTYIFLMDIYGYVLLRNGRLRLARTLLLQCVHHEAYYAATYLHLAEWYIEYYGKNKHRNEHWKKAAKLCLYIALYTERLDARRGFVSKTGEKARAILRTL